ncbi:MAG: hypothetical protein OXQ94_00485 [Gemmatimonadota bacterium]|nr:hypothetical protein [Gemmatimonadota bacterium]MDE2870157.1 hypothetical protein [Gemmatimonadota bacterium]
MKNKSTWILVAFLANLALLPLVFGPPEGRAQQRAESVFFPCCKKTSFGKRYCCNRCCILVWNCQSHLDCERRNE